MHPVLFRVPTGWLGIEGSLPVFSYGALLGISTIVGWFLTRAIAWRRDGFPVEQSGWLFVVSLSAAMVGARLLYVLTNLERFDSVRQMLRLSDGGLVAYGGFLGGYLGAWLACRRAGRSVLAWGDAAAPGVGIGLFLTRIGCLLYGCDYGRLSSGPMALRFPPGSPAYTTQRAEGLLDEYAARSLPVHPTQLYESAVGLLLFVVALWLWRRRTWRGEVMLGVTMLYALLRFLLEFLRGDTQRGAYAGLSTSQLIGLLTFGLAFVSWRRLASGVALERVGGGPLVG